DGHIVDVVALGALCKRYDAALILDEAHAVGARGPSGRGIAADVGVVPDVVIGTFGKAFGTFGAFVASTRAVADLLWNRARSFVFSTGMPPSVAAATRAALDIVCGAEGDERRRTLVANAIRFRTSVQRAGGTRDGAIAPVRVDNDRRVMALSAALLEHGVFVQGIRPPTVPVGTARLRVSLSAAHTLAQVEHAASAITATLGASATGR
ncbi:MAG TPA: aminotransferase class I/II-fold pyridoxal phosphate-dependent enzyme, partial [Kofleriaceae bacterium]|nr:aminotransferase class I/II-fold pyridoxal phosphate-dependent enzyme [Kofleriaceae bacterium]